MILIDEILKQLGFIEYLAERKVFRLEKGGVSFLLECLDNGPTGGRALRLVHRTPDGEVEMRFEERPSCWLPYYLRDPETEIFLYGSAGARQNLRVDMEAGSTLIQRACLLELSLRTHGLDRIPEECLYHPLFAGGVS